MIRTYMKRIQLSREYRAFETHKNFHTTMKNSRGRQTKKSSEEENYKKSFNVG